MFSSVSLVASGALSLSVSLKLKAAAERDFAWTQNYLETLTTSSRHLPETQVSAELQVLASFPRQANVSLQAGGNYNSQNP